MAKSWQSNPWVYVGVIVAAGIAAGLTTSLVTQKLNLETSTSTGLPELPVEEASAAVPNSSVHII